MQKFSLVVESEQECQDVIDQLWNRLGVRGELEVIPMEGKIKMDIISEKDLTAQQMEKLPGKRA